jgi:hypothetical protein
MFTIECSKPWAKKVVIGSHIARTLPVVEVEVIAITTPIVTIPLQKKT